MFLRPSFQQEERKRRRDEEEAAVAALNSASLGQYNETLNLRHMLK
jgi:hypothetical protein